MIWWRDSFGQRFNEWIKRILLSVQIKEWLKIEKCWFNLLLLKCDINEQLKQVIIVNMSKKIKFWASIIKRNLVL